MTVPPRRHAAATRFIVVVAALACAPTHYHMPSSLRGYTVLVPARDSLSERLAEALRHHGFTLQRRVRGGSGPVAALVHFTFRERDSTGVTWLHVRLADTRTGVIVGAVSVVLDTLSASGAGRAEAIVDSLATGREP